MVMPLNLLLVRHGQSEGNLANQRSREGGHTFPDEFRDRHSSLWRLTDLGKRQAITAGEWVDGHFDHTFRRYYVSTYLRARETAGLMDLANAEWTLDSHLRERDLGILERLPEERLQFKEELRRREIDGFHWRPTGGESITDLGVRLNLVLDRLHRKCAEGNAIIVCHGEVMWTLRYLLERMTPAQFKELVESDDPHDRIHNGQILQYSRVNPKTGSVTKSTTHMRSICPWDQSKSRNEWSPILRRRYTNDDLLQQAAVVERIIHD